MAIRSETLKALFMSGHPDDRLQPGGLIGTPDLLDKPRMLAVSKSDLIDKDLENMLKPTLPKGVPVIFISAMTNLNLQKLKDELWKMLNAEK